MCVRQSCGISGAVHVHGMAVLGRVYEVTEKGRVMWSNKQQGGDALSNSNSEVRVNWLKVRAGYTE